MRHAVILSFLLATCGCARQVARGTDEGVIAIPFQSNLWPLRYRDRAEAMMLDHFPEGYVVEEEYEAVVGQVAHLQARAERADTKSISATQTASDKTEWRIRYRRR